MNSKSIPCHPVTGAPAGSTDTHLHVFDPQGFAYAADRVYTPGTAGIAQIQAVHAALGIARRVLVQPSVYGTDNRCLLDAVQRLGTASTRAIAVVDLAGVSDRELADLHAGGVRGIRLNLAVHQASDPQLALAQFRHAAAVIRRPDWCVQVHGSSALLGVLTEAAAAFSGALVLDHFAGLRPTGVPEGDVLALERLLDTGAVWIKLSAFYRASRQHEPHGDLAPLVQRLVRAAPERLVWGSDWPHTGGGQRDPSVIEPFRPVDLAASLRSLRAWCADDRVWQRVLVDNPAFLYGFDAAPTPTPEPGDLP